MPGCLVAGNETLAIHLVDDRGGHFILLIGLALIAGFDGGNDFLDIGSEIGAQARVVLAMLFRLAGALPGLC